MSTAPSSVDTALRESLSAILGIDAACVATFDDATPLFGALPEFDSMAVATLLTDFEDRLGILIDDDDLDTENFERFGDLKAFLTRKVAAQG